MLKARLFQRDWSGLVDVDEANLMIKTHFRLGYIIGTGIGTAIGILVGLVI